MLQVNFFRLPKKAIFLHGVAVTSSTLTAEPRVRLPVGELSVYSSIGRAVDCSSIQLSIGSWFESGWTEYVCIRGLFFVFFWIDSCFITTHKEREGNPTIQGLGVMTSHTSQRENRSMWRGVSWTKLGESLA